MRMIASAVSSNPDRSSRSDAYLPKSKMAVLAKLFDRGPIALRGTRRILDLPTEHLAPTLIVSAADEMLDSAWAKDQTPRRAEALAKIMRGCAQERGVE